MRECGYLNYYSVSVWDEFDQHRLAESDLQYMWHYTSVNAFANIVSGGKIRFTDCLFLNDREEFNYIFTVINEYISRKLPNYKELKSLKDVIGEDNYEFLPLNTKNDRSYNFCNGHYYVLSGSENGDCLPLWNYYAKSNYSGYAVKIEIGKLFNAFKKYKQGKIFVGRVIYDLEEQLKIIQNILETPIDSYIDIVANGGENENSESEMNEILNEAKGYRSSDIYEFLNLCRLFFKDVAFSYESEIRVVLLANNAINNGEKLGTDFVVSNGVIKPTVSVDIKEYFPFEEVRVSCTIDIDLANKGIERLLENSEYKDKVKVTASNLKVRF